MPPACLVPAVYVISSTLCLHRCAQIMQIVHAFRGCPSLSLFSLMIIPIVNGREEVEKLSSPPSYKRKKLQLPPSQFHLPQRRPLPKIRGTRFLASALESTVQELSNDIWHAYIWVSYTGGKLLNSTFQYMYKLYETRGTRTCIRVHVMGAPVPCVT